eukprot:1153536-Alexandrium_andersonii.AAC.1
MASRAPSSVSRERREISPAAGSLLDAWAASLRASVAEATAACQAARTSAATRCHSPAAEGACLGEP